MTALVGITLTVLFLLQAFQQAIVAIPPEWLRNNESQTLPSSLKVAFGSIFSPREENQNQNGSDLDQISDEFFREFEESSSDGPIPTPLPPMIAINLISEISNASKQSNETLIHSKDSNITVPELELTHQLNVTASNTTQKPETTTTESTIIDESGSGYFPANDEPINVTTKNPATTTEEIYNQTKLSTTKPPQNSTMGVPPAFREKGTTLPPESEAPGRNLTFEVRENSDRDSPSDTATVLTENKKGQPWAIVLVVGVVIGIIALGSFIYINRRNKRDFSHRKLVEEKSPDPVLRLDNSEPLDLRFGNGFGYYNAGLQGDNIQMTNFPQGRSK